MHIVGRDSMYRAQSLEIIPRRKGGHEYIYFRSMFVESSR